MEDKRQTESVLAKLMGLERTLPCRQLRYARKRVLSDSYLQGIALVHQGKKKGSFEGISMDAEDNKESPKKTQRVSQSSVGKGHHVKLLSPLNGGKRERDCLLGIKAVRHGSMAAHGVANQVVSELQRSAWHDYFLNAAGPVPTSDEIGAQNPYVLSNSKVGHSESSKSTNKDFNLHMDWCLNPVNEGNAYCKEISPCINVETLLTKNKFDDLPQQVVSDASIPLRQAYNGSPRDRMEEAYQPHPEDSAANIKYISAGAHLYGTRRRKCMEVNDAEEGCYSCHIPGTYKAEEIQVLSHVVDVLAEWGLECGRLEKKGRKQPSDWKLLFDRIKCALSDILLHPYAGIRTWNLQGNQDMIKKELMAVLVNQEKEAKREPSDKAVGMDPDWLDLAEDIQIVVKEIEEILINELLEEMISRVDDLNGQFLAHR